MSMRTIAAILIAAIVVLLLSGFVVIYAGIYDVAATASHWRVTVWLIETARIRSIKAHAAEIQTPPGLDDPAKVVIGIGHYAAHCARLPRRARRSEGRYRARALSAAARPGLRIQPLHTGGAVLDRQTRDQDDRHAGMERSQQRGTLGDRGIPTKAAGHERAGICQTRDGEHGPRRTPSFRQCQSRFCTLGRRRHSPIETMI